MTELYPDWARGVHGLYRYANRGLVELATTRQWRSPRRLPLDDPVPSPLRQTRILPADLASDDTAALIGRAHQERATLYAVLAAAQLKSIAAEFDEPVPLSLLTTVNIRRRLEPSVDEEDLGLYATTMRSVYRVASGTPTWDLARQIRQAIRQRWRSRHPALFGFDRYVKAAVVRRLMRVDDHRLKQIAQHLDRRSPAASVLSMIPTLTNVRAYGPLLVTSVNGALSQTHYHWLSTASVFNGHLRWTFNYHQGSLRRRRAQQLVDRSLDVLRAAI
jgi:hypothetical protein